MHQFEFDSSKAGHLRTLGHAGEEFNKCNKCYYISAQVSNYRTHIKTVGEFFNKYDDCGKIIYSWTVHLRIHVEEIHCGERSNNCSHGPLFISYDSSSMLLSCWLGRLYYIL